MMVRCGTDSWTVCKIFRAGMQEQVHVSVDQAGEQSCVAEIDDLRPGWMINGRAGGSDAVALDQYFAWRDDVSGLDVQEPRGMEDDRAASVGRRGQWR